MKGGDFGVVQHFWGESRRFWGSFNIFWGERWRFWGPSTFFGVDFEDFGVSAFGEHQILGSLSRFLERILQDFRGSPSRFWGKFGAFGGSEAFWGELGRFWGSQNEAHPPDFGGPSDFGVNPKDFSSSGSNF